MFFDVRAACEQVGEVRVCEAPGGQGEAVTAMLATLSGPVAVVNADVPCVTAEELSTSGNLPPGPYPVDAR